MTIPRFCKSCLARLAETEHDVCSKMECLDKERIAREGVLSRSKEVMLRMLENDIEQFECSPMVATLSKLGALAKRVSWSKFDDVTWAVKEREALIAEFERNEKLIETCTCKAREAAEKGESLKGWIHASTCPARPQRVERDQFADIVIMPKGMATFHHRPQENLEYKRMILRADYADGDGANFAGGKPLEDLMLVDFSIGGELHLPVDGQGKVVAIPASLFSELAIGGVMSSFFVHWGVEWTMTFASKSDRTIRLTRFMLAEARGA